MAKVRLTAGLCVLLYFLVFAGSAPAQVSGVCSNCHTMHNSQNGSAVDADGPSGNLLNNDCVGCHSNTTTTDTIVNGTPIVFNTTAAPTYPPDGSASSALAGGNFYWVRTAGGDDAKGHNVFGISDIDGTLSEAPGRRVTCAAACHGSLATSEPENGCKGCHVPRHHADDSATVVNGTGGWYRFLADNPAMDPSTDPQSPTGVIGIEAPDWEQNPSSSSHNVYKGTTTVYAKAMGGYSGAEYITENSIGSFCTGCHGLFHHEMNEDQPSLTLPGDVSGAWLRHPSDVVIPASGEYNSYTTYNPIAPTAKTTVTTVSDTVTPGSDVVTCISCHRAHGSPYPDMLRWDYNDTDGDGNSCKTGIDNADCGCFTCHSAKDASP